MQENNNKQACELGSKIYTDIKTVLHRLMVVIFAIGIVVPLAYMHNGYIISLFFIGFYAAYHLVFFRFTKPRF